MALSDEDFQRRFTVGKKYEHYVAERLEELGLDVEVTSDDTLAEDRDVEHYTRYDTDLAVGDKVIEVKSRAKTCTFTGPEDFPFGDCFLDTVGGWNKKERKPDYYVIVSQVTGGIVVVDGTTQPEWAERQVYDRACGHKNNCFCADKSLLHPVEWLVDQLMTYTCTDTSHVSMLK